jgi:release factor glutamine methyltransferase
MNENYKGANPRKREDRRPRNEEQVPENLVAGRNAVKNGVEKRVDFYEYDLLGAPVCSENRIFARAPYDLILSNPPYLSAAEMAARDKSVLAEPTLALDGGEDGLRFYRHFLSAYTHLLTPTGAFLFEIGWEQGDALRALGEEWGLAVEILCDYGGRERVAVLSRR